MNKLYRYLPKGEKESSAVDGIILVLLVIVVIFTKRLSQLFTGLPSPFNIICQVLLFAAIVAGLFILYNRRIAKYRYGIAYKYIPPTDEEIENGASLNKDDNTDFDPGTLIFERTVAGKGKTVEIVYKTEVLAILKPDESVSSITDGDKLVSIPFIRQGVFTVLDKKTAHKLIYKRHNRYYEMIFHPDEKILELFEESKN